MDWQSSLNRLYDTPGSNVRRLACFQSRMLGGYSNEAINRPAAMTENQIISDNPAESAA